MHAKVPLLIADEDIRAKCLEFLRSLKARDASKLEKFKTWIEEKLLPEIPNCGKNTISTVTVRRWMPQLGFDFTNKTTGLYFDGHERDDVVEYRAKFIEKFEEYRPHFSVYDGAAMDQVTDPVGRRIVPVTHDECTFYAHDGLTVRSLLMLMFRNFGSREEKPSRG
jgi:hypothetical protein